MPYFMIRKKTGGSVTVKPFATATDAEITAMLDAVRSGDLTVQDLGWQVGDKRTVNLGTIAPPYCQAMSPQTATLIIQHGAGAFDLVGGGKNLFVIGFENCLAEPAMIDYNPVYTYRDVDEEKTQQTEIKQYIDCTFNALPEEVKKWFKDFIYEVDYLGEDGYFEGFVEYTSKFSIPSAWNLFGPKFNSGFWNPSATQFDLYKTAEGRQKGLGNNPSENVFYWTSCVQNARTSGDSMYYVLPDGTWSLDYNDNNNFDMPNGFSPFGCV